MLEPNSRRLLLEALRPPDGYRVDRAVATTYTLDLLALLTAPLAFSLYDALADDEEDSHLDSLALLHAVRDHASRLSVFCQAGGIAAPARYRPMLGYLESSVTQVKARGERGIFHPKLWVLRMRSTAGESTLYRLLVSSRNLTFDRSWDTLLVLDGTLRDRRNAIATSRPLAELVAALPGLALRPVSQRIADDVTLVADELLRVEWEVPEPFESLTFWPLGHDGKRRDVFPQRIDRALVVSPFLTPEILRRTSQGDGGHVLVSRLEELERVGSDALTGFESIYVLQDAIDPDDEEAPPDADVALPDRPPPRGLHAKLFVLEAGWDAHVLTGSANATGPAFSNNVELLVQLTAKKSKVGITKLLGEPNAGLLSLLVPYRSGAEPSADLQERLERELEGIVGPLALRPWTVQVTRSTGAETFDAQLHTEPLDLEAGVSLTVRPISLSETYARAIDPTAPCVTFLGCSAESLTPFFAFHVTLRRGELTASSAFVLHVPGNFDDLGFDRGALLLASLLGDQSRLLRFLRLLLALDGLECLESLADLEGDDRDTARSQTRRQAEPPLLESLLRSLDRAPHKLASVERLLSEVSKLPEADRLLPPELLAVWAPILAVWRRGDGGQAR